MPLITKLGEQKRRANRVNVYLDGKFAFACNKRVAQRFELNAGMELTPEELSAILSGEIQQECFDRAMQYLARRMHSQMELKRKLLKAEFVAEVIDIVLQKLRDLNYVDDAEFARQKLQQAQRKLVGERRAMLELRKSGVDAGTARHAVEEHFNSDLAADNAQTLITKNVSRLSRLDPVTAKRRLIGLLQRRGFDYETIKPLVDKAMGEMGEQD